MEHSKHLYVLANDDELELPVMVTDSLDKMAYQMKRNPSTLKSCTYKGVRIKWGNQWYFIHKIANEV